MQHTIINLLNILNTLEKHESKCYTLTIPEFETVCETIYGTNSDINISHDGIVVIAENGQYKDETDLINDLTLKLQINIKSIHATNTDDNIYIITC